MKLGSLEFESVENHLDLVAEPVKKAIKQNNLTGVLVAEIDPDLADTTAFCDRYGIDMDVSANCVVLEAKRTDKNWYAACLILAITRADINGVIRKQLDARKVSFAPMDQAVTITGMEYGGITPIGLPKDWPILIDEAIANIEHVVIGSGIRKSKLVVPGKLFADLPNVTIMDIAKAE